MGLWRLLAVFSNFLVRFLANRNIMPLLINEKLSPSNGMMCFTI